MTESIKLIAQLHGNGTGEILESKEVPNLTSIEKLGYTHEEQIQILKTSQDFYLEFQSKRINSNDSCPNSGKTLRKQGTFQSSFHALFTDQKLTIQRKTCMCKYSWPVEKVKFYQNYF